MRDRRKRSAAAAPAHRWKTWLWPSLVSALAVAGAFIGICALLVWLGDPATDVGASSLGSVLEAQAAMTAIFLVVMIFIVEAVQRREGLDDPLYELFLSKTWVRWIFALAVWMLTGTALLYAIGPITGLIGELTDARGDVLGISSLIIAAVLVLAFLLRALHVLRPEQYREFRRDAVLSEVRRGAQSQAQARVLARQSSHEFIRQRTGALNDPETRATRAIERVVDQTHQAVGRAQLTEIREGMEILECICATVLNELEQSDSEPAMPDSTDDRLWLGHDSILSGMQRMVRTAASSATKDAVLWAIFRADVQKARTTLATPYRLGENVSAGNELFVQVMLECIMSEQAIVVDMSDSDMSIGFRSPQEEMLSQALGNALSGAKGKSDGASESRLAKRVIAFIHTLASDAAIGTNERPRDEKRALAILKIFLQHRWGVLQAGAGAPEYGAANSRLLTQASISSIGYAVGVGAFDFLDIAVRRLKIGELVEKEAVNQTYALIEEDFREWAGGEPALSAGLLWLAASIATSPPKPDSASDIEQIQAECLTLGYMWLIGVSHRSAPEVNLPGGVREEVGRVWRMHGARLVAALEHAGARDGRDMNSWCAAAFS